MPPVTALFIMVHTCRALMRMGAVRSTVAVVSNVLKSLPFGRLFGSRARNGFGLVSMIVMWHNT